uniref:Si:ch211-225b7.5 n=1 Tax=Cyprinus carpio carpio TaxID=630221 RepID=A0A9J7YIU8_CYPCA
MDRLASVIGQQHIGLTVGLSLMIIVVIIVLAGVVYTPPGATTRCLRRSRSEEHLSLTANRIS